MIFLDIVTVMSVGLMTGAEFAVSAFINPVLWRMEDEGQGFAVRAFARMLGRVMPFWYGGNMLLLAAEAIVRRSQPGAWLLDVACGPGLVACAFARVAKEVTGIDLTPAMIDEAAMFTTEMPEPQKRSMVTPLLRMS